jgi:ABC-type spermidine/putrescine transport system permease subunit I
MTWQLVAARGAGDWFMAAAAAVVVMVMVVVVGRRCDSGRSSFETLHGL